MLVRSCYDTDERTGGGYNRDRSGGPPVLRLIALILLLASAAAAQAPQAQAAQVTTELVLDNAAARVYRATIPPHQRLRFQASADVIVVRMNTHESAYLPGHQAFTRPNRKNSEATDLIVELKNTPGEVATCPHATTCTKDTLLGGAKVGETTMLFSGPTLVVTRQQMAAGKALSTSLNGGDQLLLIPFTDLRVNVGGEEKQVKAGEPFFADGGDVQIGGAGHVGKWMALRLRSDQ